MEVIDKDGNIVGRVVKNIISWVSGGRSHTQEVVLACLMLPGREAERRTFDSVFAAREWVVREAGV